MKNNKDKNSDRERERERESDILMSEEKINVDNLIISRKQVIKNNYWNEEHEEILISLQKICFRLNIEYQKTYFKYKKRLQWYRIPIIIISAIGGFLSLSNSGYIPPAYNKWISLFVGFSNLLVTIISLIENFKKIDTFVNGTYSAHLNFQKLHDEIALIKRIPPNEREENGYDTISKLFTQYQNYLIEAPVLSKIIKDDLGRDEINEDGTLKSNGLSRTLSKLSDLEKLELQINKINKTNSNFEIKRKIDIHDRSDDIEELLRVDSIKLGSVSSISNIDNKFIYDKLYDNKVDDELDKV
jgi:hypothetical protein